MTEIKNLPKPHLHHELLPDTSRVTYKWDIVFVIIFITLALFAGSSRDVMREIGRLEAWEVFVLIFAVFRLTHLVTNDAVMQWFRDLFLVVEETKKEDGTIMVARTMPEKGVRRELALLFDCPWCVSVWMSLVCLMLWIFIPASQFLLAVLALAGAVVSFFVIIKKIQA